MSDTVVIQSFRTTDVPPWLTRCLATVEAWAREQGYAYRFLDDELFAPLPARFRLRTEHLLPMRADLGRLVAIEAALAEGFRRAVWIDADVLVFGALALPDQREHYFCREVWLEPGVVDHRVNNAVCAFTAASTLLPFYRTACLQIVDDTSGALDPLALGTRWLTMLDRIVRLPRLDAIALASPFVLRELAETTSGPLLETLRRHHGELAAINLCASFRGKTARAPGVLVFDVDDALYTAVVDRLLTSRR